MHAAVEVDGLRKVFEVRERPAGLRAALHARRTPPHTRVAVDGITLRIERGERVALVGPNGTGKSTALKLLCGILQPTSGRLHVLGVVPWTERRTLGYRVGAVFRGRFQPWRELPAGDGFELLRHVYDQEPRSFARRRDALLATFELGPELRLPLRLLAPGARARCELVASLLHGPELLLLDEPALGLDAAARSALFARLREQAARDGCTVLLAARDPAGVDAVCERVIVLRGGRVIADGDVRELRAGRAGTKRIVVESADREPRVALHGVRVIERAPYRVELEVDLRRIDLESVIEGLLRLTRIRDLTITEPPVEEVVRALYDDDGGELMGHAAPPDPAELPS